VFFLPSFSDLFQVSAAVGATPKAASNKLWSDELNAKLDHFKEMKESVKHFKKGMQGQMKKIKELAVESHNLSKDAGNVKSKNDATNKVMEEAKEGVLLFGKLNDTGEKVDAVVKKLEQLEKDEFAYVDKVAGAANKKQGHVDGLMKKGDANALTEEKALKEDIAKLETLLTQVEEKYDLLLQEATATWFTAVVEGFSSLSSELSAHYGKFPEGAKTANADSVVVEKEEEKKDEKK
jgi:hypothetical protein